MYVDFYYFWVPVYVLGKVPKNADIVIFVNLYCRSSEVRFRFFCVRIFMLFKCRYKTLPKGRIRIKDELLLLLYMLFHTKFLKNTTLIMLSVSSNFEANG